MREKIETLYSETLDYSAHKYVFSHQIAFNMRYKILMTLQSLFENNLVLLSGISEFDETFVLDCYKGGHVPKGTGHATRKHDAKAAKRDISNE